RFSRDWSSDVSLPISDEGSKQVHANLLVMAFHCAGGGCGGGEGGLDGGLYGFGGGVGDVVAGGFGGEDVSLLRRQRNRNAEEGRSEERRVGKEGMARW